MIHLPLAIMLVLAAALRFWGISWGLPLKHAHIDESVVTFYALRVLAGDPNPQVFFDYPAFFLYLLNAIFRISVLFSGSSLEEAANKYIQGDAALFTLSARVLNAVLSTCAVAVTYKLGLRMGNRFLAILAAGLLAVNGLHTLHAHYGTVDTAAALFALLAIYHLVVYRESGEIRAGYWAAGWIGLGAATKYYPALLGICLIAIPFFKREKRAGLIAFRFVLLSAAVFSIASPFSILEWPRSFSRMVHLFGNVAGGATARTILLPTLANLWSNAGPLVLLAAGYGMWAGYRRKAPKIPPAEGSWALITTALGLLVVFFGLWASQLDHYTLLAYPIIFLWAARGALALKSVHTKLPLIAAIVLLLSSIIPAIWNIRLLTFRDTRLMALDWARGHLSAGNRILRFAHTPEFTAQDSFKVTVDWENKVLASWMAGEKGARQKITGFDHLIYSSYDPANDNVLQRLLDNYRTLVSFEGPRRFPHNPSVYVFETEGKL